jgi:Ice-binding-like
MRSIFLVALLLGFSNFTWAQSAPPLGSAQSFAVLGASTVTNAGPTVITGDVGVSPGTAITGFPPGIVLGGALHPGDAAATAAHADASTAYSDLLAVIFSEMIAFRTKH